MKKQALLTLAGSFGIMLSLGGIYAWSIFVPGLMDEYQFTASQTQLVFGVVIAVFTFTMLFVEKIEKRLGTRKTALLSGLFYSLGYLVSGYSGGRFVWILIGIGMLAGIGTGFGYLVSLVAPVRWFPERKGLISGVATAGFGLAAVVLSLLAEALLSSGRSILEVFRIMGLFYGAVIMALSFLMSSPPPSGSITGGHIRDYWKEKNFLRLFFGIFTGTFAGLLIIGNLKPIGAENQINDHILVLGISIFAISNFAGRLGWGFISDYTGSALSILIALVLQSAGILLLGHTQPGALGFIFISAMIGFNFGGNFVLFARETSHLFGIHNLGILYPFIFLGYGIAGIFGPITGGIIFDTMGQYQSATTIAALMSIMGGLLFLKEARHSIIKK